MHERHVRRLDERKVGRCNLDTTLWSCRKLALLQFNHHFMMSRRASLCVRRSESNERWIDASYDDGEIASVRESDRDARGLDRGRLQDALVLGAVLGDDLDLATLYPYPSERSYHDRSR